jgi:hypothetical protein
LNYTKSIVKKRKKYPNEFSVNYGIILMNFMITISKINLHISLALENLSNTDKYHSTKQFKKLIYQITKLLLGYSDARRYLFNEFRRIRQHYILVA